MERQHISNGKGKKIMARFEPAFKFLDRDEGGYSNNSRDSGGETYRGIARNYWKLWPGWSIVDEIKKQIGLGNIKSLNQALRANVELQQWVEGFYRSNFWYSIYEQINSQVIATKLFDESVNLDTTRAVVCLQEAVNDCGLTINIDGKFGVQTLQAVNAIHLDDLIQKYIIRLREFYIKDVKENPKNSIFLNDWLQRANEIPPDA